MDASVSFHKCNGDPDIFCYICGEYKTKKNRKKLTEKIKNLYKNCFGFKIANQETNWVPHMVCGACYNMLCRWESSKKETHLKFTVPMKWSEPQNSEDCYFCMTNVTGFNNINVSKISYANVSTVTPPLCSIKNIENLKESSVTSSFSKMELDEYSEEYESDDGISGSDDYTADGQGNTAPQTFTQKELNDLIRDLGLPKDGAEYLASVLKKKNLFSKETKISFYRDREKEFRKYFSRHSDLVYCSDIQGLMNELKPNIYKAVTSQ